MGRRAQRRRRDAARPREQMYHFFLHFKQEMCSDVNYVIREYPGNDERAAEILLAHQDEDLPRATPALLKRWFSLREYYNRCRSGSQHLLVEEILATLTDHEAPFICFTPVVDGVITVDATHRHGGVPVAGIPTDWLARYTVGGGTQFDLPQLIHDDYIAAVKVCANAGLYVSATKLLLSSMDSLAFVAFGDKGNVFVKWLTTYADLSPLGITAEELWELRSGLLHMSNLDSRQVRKQAVRRISYGVGISPGYYDEALEIQFFDLMDLISAYADAIAKWLQSYNDDRAQFETFIERYDLIVSDARLAPRRAAADVHRGSAVRPAVDFFVRMGEADQDPRR